MRITDVKIERFSSELAEPFHVAFGTIIIFFGLHQCLVKLQGFEPVSSKVKREKRDGILTTDADNGKIQKTNMVNR